MVHAARLYLQDIDPSKTILKLDFKNAFNSIHRDKVLAVVLDHAQGLSTHSSTQLIPHHSLCSGRIRHCYQQMECNRGTLGATSLLFVHPPHAMGSQLQSELGFFFLDDGTVGGSVEDLRLDIEMVQRVGASVGLVLNTKLYPCLETSNTILSYIPGAKIVNPSQLSLLGSSICDVASITDLLH